MAKSKLILTFTSDLVAGDVISFDRYKLAEPTSKSTITETFVDIFPRLLNYTVPTALVNNPDTRPVGAATAWNFQKVFIIDYPSYFTVTYISPYIIWIELDNEEWGFNNLTLPLDVGGVIENNRTITFSLVEAIASANADPCNFYNFSIETDELATSIYIDGNLVTSTNTANPYVAPLIRGVNHRFVLENALGDKLYYPSITYDLQGNIVFLSSIKYDYLTSENITVSVNQSLIGATLILSVKNVIGLELESSLDGVNWNPITTIYTGQEVGTKVLYVRDQLGCVKSKSYTVTDFGSREPILKISKANSINFSKVEVWDGCTIFKNDENTLDCQGLQKKLYISDNLFQTCDLTTTQFKSNYETNSAVLRDSNGSDTALSVLKKSANLNRFMSMDALYYKYREGKLAIYFENGWKYNELGEQTVEYTLGGNLPEFAIIGEYITVGTLGTYKIVDTLYDAIKMKRVIIVDYYYSSIEPVTTIVQSIYDILDYEIYEFDIDWSSFSIGRYNVLITGTDTDNGTVVHNSERINLATEHTDTLAIAYSNNNNRDVFYKYGITHFIRVPFSRFVPKQQDDNEINITDDNSVVVESTVYEKNEIKFDVVSNSLMRKLVVALSCENLFVNGIGYVKDGNVDTENVDNTNLHEVTATLIKTGVSYTNFKQGQSGIDAGSGTFEAPQIITTGTNFIKA